MVGELAALATAVCWSFTSVFFSIGGRRVGSAVVNRTRLLFAIVFISVFHLFMEGVLFPFGTESWRWGILTLSSILGLGLGDGALFYAFVLIGPRLSMLVMTLVPVFSAFFAWLAFGESLRPIEFVGMAITIAAIGWVVSERRTADPSQEHNPNYLFGLGMAVIGALGQTANLVVTKYALIDGYSALSATLIRIFVALIALWLLAGWRGEVRSSISKLQDRRALLAIMAGALVGPFLGIWFSLIAVQNSRVGIASTIMALPPVLLIPLTAIFLKERVTLRALLGTGIAIGGVSLLFLSG
jgi:drug/metabolite transporter (DMT)-like permease